jgi:hypothetical protein
VPPGDYGDQVSSAAVMGRDSIPAPNAASRTGWIKSGSGAETKVVRTMRGMTSGAIFV